MKEVQVNVQLPESLACLDVRLVGGEVVSWKVNNMTAGEDGLLKCVYFTRVSGKGAFVMYEYHTLSLSWRITHTDAQSISELEKHALLYRCDDLARKFSHPFCELVKK